MGKVKKAASGSSTSHDLSQLCYNSENILISLICPFSQLKTNRSTTFDSVKYFIWDHGESSVSQISKTLPSPSPNGLEDLLREILVFKSRRGTRWKKKNVYVSCTQWICACTNWCNTEVPSLHRMAQNEPKPIISMNSGRVIRVTTKGHFGAGRGWWCWRLGRATGVVSHAR